MEHRESRSSENFCCEACFKHPWLRALVQESESQSGCCFYCGSCGALASAQSLHAGFSNLLSDYIAAETANGGGDPLLRSVTPIEAIQRDWRLFSERFIADRGEKFLSAVFKNQPLPFGNESFNVSVVPFHRNAMSTAYGKWLEFWMIDPTVFSDWSDRYAPSDIDTIGTGVNLMSEHLQPFVRLLPAGQKLWRARTNYVGFSDWNCQPLPLKDMGHNPDCPASRLNRKGEIVLYCAEAEKTAIAEIRPGRGYICTTCQLTILRDIQVLDLAASLETINPFTCTNLSWHLDLQRVARNLGHQIATPTSRGEDPVVYNKTQFLGMVVRAMQIDGVRFSSSLDTPSGVNIALFDPTVVKFSNARLVAVTSTDIAYERIGANKRDILSSHD